MDLVRRLHLAIKNHDKDSIHSAVSAGADMDYVWGMQGTALCQAITTGRYDLVSLLLDLGCDVNGEDYDGGLPLSLAIRKRLTPVALLLISVPACNLNALDPVSKQRPLCAAVLEGLTEVVEVLVQDPRCDITQGNSVGNTALHLSLLHRQDSITKILARCHGFRFLHNLAGHAPVHIVATLGHTHSLDLLFPAPARTAETFHRSAETFPRTGGAGQEGEGGGDDATGLVRTSPAQRRELDQRASYTGDTPLHLAVREKHVAMATRLVELGAGVVAENNSGQTALLLACANDSTTLALALLEQGAPPGVAGRLKLQDQTLLARHARETSLSPLHVAAHSNNLPLVRALVEHGASVSHGDERGRSPLFVALMQGAEDSALFLANLSPSLAPPPQTPPPQAPPPWSAPMGVSLLHAACRCPSRSAEIASALLDRGCPLDVADRHGNQPLHEAVCWEREGMVRVLLDHGADPTTRGECDTPPLTLAARTGRVDIAALLLGAGADINGRDHQGDNPCGNADSSKEELSPLQEALDARMVDFVRYLAEQGCDLSSEKYLYTESLPAVASPQAMPRLSDSEDSDDDIDDSEDSDDHDDSVPDVVKGDVELFRFLRDKARNPASLLQLSVDGVRAVFRTGDPPFGLMLALPLPEKFIAKLFYKEAL